MRVAFCAIASLFVLTGLSGEAQARGDCPRGYEQSGLLCYQPCRSGFSGVGPVCWQRCPRGFADHGAFCGKPGPYGRGAGYPWKFGDTPFSLSGAWARCQRDHGRGRCEQNGLLVYPKCKAGFHNVGCCICSPNCPAGMKDIGVSCAKQSYGRGVGKPLKSVTQAFDKAGKWLKKAISDAGRALKSLGQKVLDGLKKVGKDIAKGALRGPFHLYIEGNRAAYLRKAKPMTAAEKSALLAFFPRRIVDKVRVLEHPKWTGFFNFSAGATTYGELVIVRRGQRSVNILKHELVHVCQYDKYGRKGFAHRYADQYVDSGFSYPNIFFEKQAYDFQRHGTGPVSKLLGYCQKSGSVGSTSAPLTASPKKCSPVRCRMYCRCGWAKGPDGCPRCACAKCGTRKCRAGQIMVRGRCVRRPVRKCRPGYSFLVGRCRKSSRPIGVVSKKYCRVGAKISFRDRCSCPPGTKVKNLNRTYRMCVRTGKKRYCRVGAKISYRDRCACPRGTKVKNLNRTYRMCVRTGRPVLRPVKRPWLIKRPVFKKPVFKKPVFKGPVFKRPVLKRPVLKRPVLKRPVLKRPVLKRPVLKRPVFKRPVLKKRCPPGTRLMQVRCIRAPCPARCVKSGGLPTLRPLKPTKQFVVPKKGATSASSKFQTISNAMKAKHDAAMNSIRNMK